VLNSKLDLRNIMITKRNGSVNHADIVGYRLGGLLSSNPMIEQGDVINLRKLSEDPFYVSISGAVKTPITIPIAKDDTALDLLTIAGGKSRISAGNQNLIYRLKLPTPISDQSDPTQTSDDAFDLFTLTDDQLAEFELVPGDRMIIPVDHSQRTIHHVKISGEVIRPGTYPIIEGVTTLFELMNMAGGATENALLNAIEITRTSDPGMTFQIVEGEFQPLPDIFRVSDQFEESRLLLQNQVLMDNNVIYADLSGLFGEKHLSEMNTLDSKDEFFNADVPLFSEDVVHIPKDQNTIRIMGQIGVPGFYPFNPDFTYQDYIATASGLSPAADSSRIFIIKAATKNWIPAQNTTLSSGDILFVDSRPIGSYALAQDLEIRKIDLELRRETLVTEKKRANLQIFVSLVNVTASVITTYLLIRR
jgi:protein involved in polysaccharide export with SLBB domain